jgi:hypothetical protein
MKAWSVVSLLFTAAILSTIPVSPQLTPRGVELSVDQARAQATYGHHRQAARRAYRSAGYARLPRAMGQQRRGTVTEAQCTDMEVRAIA